jgi:acetate kinase
MRRIGWGDGVRVLSVNAGSSSLKLALIGDDGETLAAAEIELDRDELDAAALERALRGPLADADAVGHRIVHGGRRFTAAVRIGAGVEAELRELADLAPLHQRRSLSALHAVGALLGELPAVACFDTAFHARMPAAAATYALPARWREGLAVHRYGFHGLSHSWVSRRVTELLGMRPPRLVSCHLGAGASLCAIADGVSVDTTMGFTPLEGLAMATRSGSVDPGLLLWLIERGEASAGEVAVALEHESGLLGLCGSADMRVVSAGAAKGDAGCELALDVYLHRLRSEIASMAAALGGIDALAFTGGVGERSAEVRRLAVEGLGFLGVRIDAGLNEGQGERGEQSAVEHDETGAAAERGETDAAAERGEADREISAAEAGVRTLVIEAREDLEIARQTRAVLGES